MTLVGIYPYALTYLHMGEIGEICALPKTEEEIKKEEKRLRKKESKK